MVDITAFAWGVVCKQLLTDPMAALTTPQFLVQRVGAESNDRLGLVWQSNVFGHYVLVSVKIAATDFLAIYIPATVSSIETPSPPQPIPRRSCGVVFFARCDP